MQTVAHNPLVTFLWNQAKRTAPFCFVAFVCGMLALFLAQEARTSLSGCYENYYLISPATRCSNSINQGEWDYEELRGKLLIKKNELVKEEKLTQLSVYFRDLNYGPRFGIGEYDRFQPASLLKLPVMIAFLHEADRDPSVLDVQLTYTGSININENVEEASETIKPDTPYTIRELIRKMIVYSDNYSYIVLMKRLNATPQILTYHTFRDLNILRMMVAPNADYVSIQNYSNLFVVLYNTGYLSKEMSEYALDLLSQATFTDGLVKGVPVGTIVAHKFGHRILQDEEQLHDCGIIYHPETHYLLCVMTSGKNYEGEKEAIAAISKIVYDGVTQIHSSNGESPGSRSTSVQIQ